MAEDGVVVTVTFSVVLLALQPVAVMLSFTATVAAPALVHDTVMLLVPCPELIAPPVTVQLYVRPAVKAVL